MLNARQLFGPVLVAAATMSFANSSVAEPNQATKPPSDAELREYREKTEGLIQKCIRDKAASPEICRMSAYAAALAVGLSPEVAAQATGYNPK